MSEELKEVYKIIDSRIKMLEPQMTARQIGQLLVSDTYREQINVRIQELRKIKQEVKNYEFETPQI